MTAVEKQLESLIGMVRVVLTAKRKDGEPLSLICDAHQIGLEYVIKEAEAALKAAKTNE